MNRIQVVGEVGSAIYRHRLTITPFTLNLLRVLRFPALLPIHSRVVTVRAGLKAHPLKDRHNLFVLGHHNFVPDALHCPVRSGFKCGQIPHPPTDTVRPQLGHRIRLNLPCARSFHISIATSLPCRTSISGPRARQCWQTIAILVSFPSASILELRHHGHGFAFNSDLSSDIFLLLMLVALCCCVFGLKPRPTIGGVTP